MELNPQQLAERQGDLSQLAVNVELLDHFPRFYLEERDATRNAAGWRQRRVAYLAESMRYTRRDDGRGR